jgi:hypothetical protein
MRNLKLFLPVLALAGLLAGCGTVGGLFTATSTVTPAQTNYTAVVSPPTTNVAGIVTPPQTNLVAVITPAVTNTTYTVAPAIQGVINGAQSLAPFAPAPFDGLAKTGLGLLSGVLAIVAAWKSKQLSSAQKIAAVVQPVVAGVEAAANPAVKQAIQSHAVAAGVQAVLDPIVQAVSQQMPAPASGT